MDRKPDKYTLWCHPVNNHSTNIMEFLVCVGRVIFWEKKKNKSWYLSYIIGSQTRGKKSFKKKRKKFKTEQITADVYGYKGNQPRKIYNHKFS